MTEIKKESFYFSGSSGQSIVKTANVPGPIQDVALTHQKYTGKANKSCNWKIIGSVLQVRCTFWGWSGSSGTASLGFNVYYQKARVQDDIPVAAIEEDSQLLSVELDGDPGEKFEKTFNDFGGQVKSFELLGQKNNAVTDIELNLIDDRTIQISGVFDSTANDKMEETIFVQISTQTK